jgi:serine/threonine protein kinase
MTPVKWGRIKNIFLGALTQPGPAHADFARRKHETDPEVEFEVGRLLEATETASGVLEAPAVHLHGRVSGPPIDSYSLLPGSFISNRFEILRFLNRGGMGEVYEAWDAELKERVAVKTIRPKIAFDSEVIARFKREVKHGRVISHPNVCRVHELFSHESRPGHKIWFLSMEFLEGSTLLEHIRYQGPIEPARALSLIEQMVSGLMEAHSHGLVHRDFKSSNVFLIDRAGGHTRAVITDFGLSLSIFRPREGLSEPAGMGTPGYMAPEQRECGEVGPLADQYALGVVMYEMLTGSLPPGLNGRPVLKLSERKLGSRWERVIRPFPTISYC